MIGWREAPEPFIFSLAIKLQSIAISIPKMSINRSTKRFLEILPILDNIRDS